MSESSKCSPNDNESTAVVAISSADFDRGDGDLDESEIIDYSDIIEENHLLLVTHLQLDRHFLFSYLRSNGILDEEDVEIVTNAGITRQQRVSRFLDLIKRKGKIGMAHFVNALQYENPDCFEKLTGKKAKTRPPNFAEYHHFEDPQLPVQNGASNDIDSRYLAKQLTQTMQEMHCLTQVHQKVINEKNDLGKKLMQANNNLKLKDEEIQLRQKMQQSLLEIQSTEGNGGSSMQLNQKEIKLIQKDYMVTILQGKLLEFMEEKECLRKENMDLKTKNNEYSRVNLDLQYRYDTEKRQSILLKERVKDQEYDMSYIDRFKMDVKQNITDMKSLREENIALKKEIDEFRKYGEVLNQKFKMVVKAKSVTSDEVNSYQAAQEQISELSNANSMLLLENKHLAKANKRLMGDVAISNQLLNSIQSEWNKAIAECNRLEYALKNMKHEKEMTDKMAHSYLVKNAELNKKYSDVCKDLDELGISLQEANTEILRCKSKTGILDGESNSKCNTLLYENVPGKGILAEAATGFPKEDDIAGMTDIPKKRTNLQVLNSIKRSVMETDTENISLSPHSMSFEQINLLNSPNSASGKSASLPYSFVLNEFKDHGFACSTEKKEIDTSDDDNGSDLDNFDIPFRPRGELYDRSKKRSALPIS